MPNPTHRTITCVPLSVWITVSVERPTRSLNTISTAQERRSPENFLANLEKPAYTRGGVYLLGTHYLAPGFTHQLTPLISCSGQILVNLSDPSTWFAPQIAYNIAEDIHLSVGGFVQSWKTPESG